MNDLERILERIRQERAEEERREKREILGCTGAIALFFLVSLAIVFIGCPGAVSYGVSRGCAAGPEIGR